MSEARLWQRMRDGVTGRCFAQRIENLVGAGMPDVILHCRATGQSAWVELKHRPLYPIRRSTPVFNGDHGLRPDQKAWIYERAMGGANIWIIAQCNKDLYVLDGKIARDLELLSREALAEHKCCAWITQAIVTPWDTVVDRLILRR